MFSFTVRASDIISKLVVWSKILSDFFMGFQFSCCGHGISSLHISRPTMQLSSEAFPSTISTISKRKISDGGFSKENPPPRPLIDFISFSRASFWKIFATNCLGRSVSLQISSSKTLLPCARIFILVSALMAYAQAFE